MSTIAGRHAERYSAAYACSELSSGILDRAWGLYTTDLTEGPDGDPDYGLLAGVYWRVPPDDLIIWNDTRLPRRVKPLHRAEYAPLPF